MAIYIFFYARECMYGNRNWGRIHYTILGEKGARLSLTRGAQLNHVQVSFGRSHMFITVHNRAPWTDPKPGSGGKCDHIQ